MLIDTYKKELAGGKINTMENMKEIYVLLGRRIREERKKRDLSQEKLAFKVKISINFLGQIERGTKHATLATTSKIAEAFGLSLSELLKEEKTRHLPEATVTEKSLIYHFRERTPEEKKAFLVFLKSFPSSKSKR